MEPHRVDYSNEVPEGENVINKRREGLSEFQKNLLSSGYSLQDLGIKRRKEEINDEVDKRKNQALVDELIKKRIAKKEEEVLQTFKEIRYSWEVFWSAGPEKPICDCDSCNLHKYPYQCRSFVPPRPWVN